MKGPIKAMTPKKGQTAQKNKTPKKAQTPKKGSSPAPAQSPTKTPLNKVKKGPGSIKKEKLATPKLPQGVADDKKPAKGKASKGPKKGRPISKKVKAQNKLVRQAIATGEIAQDELKRKADRDARTLYVAFKADKLPTTIEEIEKLHPDIKLVRILRQSKKANSTIRYCFMEFASEKVCEKAKTVLSLKEYNGGRLAVDFVGAKSKIQRGPKSAMRPVNPTKLFVSGLAKGLTEDKLRELFPKASRTIIPARSVRKGSTFGFAQFNNPAEAKEAFNASQNLEFDGHHLTVLFARMDKAKKSEKADAKRKTEAESPGPQAKKTITKVEEDDDDEDDDDEEIVDAVDDDDGEEQDEDD
eukprot:TCALIF_01073-PA protein Name:"Similar to NCL Nucleolin (Gallus gallus)" AED:0.00 eAED:0.00 QI:202/1/0.5/1/1/1/2/0/355